MCPCLSYSGKTRKTRKEMKELYGNEAIAMTLVSRRSPERVIAEQPMTKISLLKVCSKMERINV